jgi:hypothetical protein
VPSETSDSARTSRESVEVSSCLYLWSPGACHTISLLSTRPNVRSAESGYVAGRRRCESRMEEYVNLREYKEKRLIDQLQRELYLP